MDRSRRPAALGAAVLATVLALAGATAAQGSSKATPNGVAVAKAQAQVVRHADRFGFGPGQALIARGVFHDRTGSAIRFDRTYRGLKVVGGDFIVHVTPSGAFRYGNGMRIGGLPRSLTPQVSASAAGATARGALHYAVTSTASTLVVFGGRLASPLAWQVDTQGRSAVNATVTYVSATTGRTLARWSTVDTAKDVGKGKTEYSGTVGVNDLKKGSTYTLHDNKRGKQQISAWSSVTAARAAGSARSTRSTSVVTR